MRLSWSHDLNYEFDRLIRIDPDRFNMLLFQYFYIKKYCLEFLCVKLYFNLLSGLSLDPSNRVNLCMV